MTPRQQEIMDFIRAFRREHGHSPILKEIAEGLNPPVTTTAVNRHVTELIEKGRLRKTEAGKSRNLEPTDEAKVDLDAVIEIVESSVEDESLASDLCSKIDNLPKHH